MSECDDKTVNKPIETLRDGALKVSIFRNHSEKGDYYALDPGRIYTDEKTNEVREASSLSGSEPLRMAHLLTIGYEKMQLHKELDKKRAKEQSQDERSSQPSRSRDDDRER
jgi:hypothetical protein